ncbi:hypothetical protein FJY63_13005, partial [Candidatus Sumerlaeota bacterium]|nr:hypothetical protein [Candidatus Sumerlaeota bacterium]
CENCKRAQPVDGETRRRLCLDLDAPIFEPVGCTACESTGYRGRTGIFEILESNDDLQEIVLRRAPARELADCARKLMAGDLWSDAMLKVQAGITSLAEACRACGCQMPGEAEDGD